jgi:transposase InsO family protein
MQIKGLHKNIYKLYAYARTQECLEVYRQKYQHQVQRWEKLASENVSLKLIQEIVGISRATYYRHRNILRKLERGIIPPSKRPHKLNKPKWGESHKQLVLQIRRENPTYGKEKIAIILKRDYKQTIGESTVGRILRFLKSKGLVTKSLSALRTKRKRVFKKHAKPWEFKDYNTMALGERVQIDHMTVTKNGITLKHFQSWERKSKYINAAVYSNAKASSAKRFLIELAKSAPFVIESVQVDGGSEFMAEFEEACSELGYPLIVLPPRKPEYNGGVERGNRTFREEFYSRTDILEDSVRGIQAALSKAVVKYNTYRPHRGLKGLTPMEYITKNTLLGGSTLSHLV